jgi:3,4-dihydroxy 2-butanone 4-phosphate synthase/GTP cyclohydrolase II
LSVDGSTTGQSTSDRATAIRAIVDPATSPADLRTPGFVQPALTTSAGVLECSTFASAATDLARLAGLAPAGVTIHILREDGELARLEDLFQLAASHQLKIVSLEGLAAHRASNDE